MKLKNRIDSIMKALLCNGGCVETLMMYVSVDGRDDDC